MARWHRITLGVAGLTVVGLLACLPESWGDEHDNIGVVLAVEGAAEVRDPSKAVWETLKFRDYIFLDDTIRTHANGKIKLLLRNDSIMTLAENSEIHITAFLLNDQQHRSLISLVVGKVRVLTTKLFGRADAMEVKTPNTVAGIRSSEEHVTYDDQTDKTTVGCVIGHCYVRHHHDPQKYLRIPSGHVTEHDGTHFPSATRRITLQEHRLSTTAFSLTAHDPRELTTGPEPSENVDRPPRRAPDQRGEDDGPPRGGSEGGEPQDGERRESPRGSGGPPLPRGEALPSPGEGIILPPLQGELSPLPGGELLPPLQGELSPPPPLRPPVPPNEVITPDTSPARPMSLIRLLIRIPPTPNGP